MANNMSSRGCRAAAEPGIGKGPGNRKIIKLKKSLLSDPFQIPDKFRSAEFSGMTRLDLHGKTEDQAWTLINELLDSVTAYAVANGNKVGLRRAQIVTGASGILKEKFHQWATESIISPRIASCKLINNGCYEIVVRKG